MYLRRRLAILATSTCLAVSAAPVPPSLAATDERLMQLNICGNVCYEGSDEAGRDIAASIASSGSAVVSLNEVCGNQLTAARDALAAQGRVYDKVFGTTITPGSSALKPACVGFGNGLLVRRVNSSTNVDSVTNDLLPDFGEDRRLLCLRVVSANYTACSTHLSAGSDATAESHRRQQVGRVVEVLRQKLALRPLVLAGDLNTKPGSQTLDSLYDSAFAGPSATSQRLQEVDACTTRTQQTSDCNEGTLSTFGTDPKVDFIFVVRNAWLVRSADATSSVTSDHDPLYATVSRQF